MSAPARESGFWLVYGRIVRALINAMVVVAATGIVAMMVVTCVEVVLRIFRFSLTGVYDIVCIAGAVTMAAALPYTTACKGHVAIEFVFQRLSRRLRIVVDTLARLAKLSLFGFLTVESFLYGLRMQATGQVTATLQIPEYWVPFVLALSCGLVCLVTIYHLFHPGREMIKP